LPWPCGCRPPRNCRPTVLRGLGCSRGGPCQPGPALGADRPPFVPARPTPPSPVVPLSAQGGPAGPPCGLFFSTRWESLRAVRTTRLQAILLPGARARPVAVPRLHDDPIRLITAIDPDHRNRPVAPVQKAMGPPGIPGDGPAGGWPYLLDISHPEWDRPGRNRSRVEGDKRTETHRAAAVVFRCFDRSDRRVQTRPDSEQAVPPRSSLRQVVECDQPQRLPESDELAAPKAFPGAPWAKKPTLCTRIDPSEWVSRK
jgi:hypothetical protein